MPELKDCSLALEVAHKAEISTDPEFRDLMRNLLRRRQLSQAVHEMNALLKQPPYTGRALTAIRRMGLEHGG